MNRIETDRVLAAIDGALGVEVHYVILNGKRYAKESRESNGKFADIPGGHETPAAIDTDDVLTTGRHERARQIQDLVGWGLPIPAELILADQR